MQQSNFWERLPTHLKLNVLHHLPVDFFLTILRETSKRQISVKLTNQRQINSNRGVELKNLLLGHKVLWNVKIFTPTNWYELADLAALTVMEPQIEELLTGLDFSQLLDPTEPEDLRAFSAILMVRFRNIQYLSLSKFESTRFFFRIMIKNRCWWRNGSIFLDSLDVSYNSSFDTSILDTILKDFSFNQLRSLDISYCTRLDDHDFINLAKSSISVNLVTLGLAGIHLSIFSLIEFLPRFSALKHLNLSDYSSLTFEELLHILTVCRHSIHYLNNPHFKSTVDFLKEDKCSTSAFSECACLLDTLESLQLSYNDSFTLHQIDFLENLSKNLFGRSLKVTHITCRLRNDEPQSILEYLLQHCE